jgi:hypothetical protein
MEGHLGQRIGTASEVLFSSPAKTRLALALVNPSPSLAWVVTVTPA